MKVGVIQPAIRRTAFAAAVGVKLLIAPMVPAQAIVPAALASPPPAQVTTGATAEVKRVIATGSYIRPRDEVAPHPVDSCPPPASGTLGTLSAREQTTS